MKNLTLLMALFITGQMYCQGIPVQINDYNRHTIWAPDTLTARAVKEWADIMEASPVEYEAAMQTIKAIQVKPLPRMQLSTRRDSIIIFNARLDKFPYCKRAAILQELYKINGGKIDKQGNYNMLSNFPITEYSNARFKQQYQRRYGINLLRSKLIQKKKR